MAFESNGVNIVGGQTTGVLLGSLWEEVCLNACIPHYKKLIICQINMV